MKNALLAAVVIAGALALPAVSNQTSSFGSVALAAQAAQPVPPPTQPADSPSAQPAQPSQAPSQPATQSASDQPTPQVTVQVQEHRWYANPTWIAIGGIGAVLLIVLLVMATRQESNTVIRG